jgi:hypothetical protein
MMNLYLFH